MSSTFDTARIFADKLDMPSSIPIATHEPRAPRPVGDRILLGDAVDPRTGVTYLVTAQRLDRDWPGTEQRVTFAVERNGGVNPDGSRYVDMAWGWFDEKHCWWFLTFIADVTALTWDLDGIVSTVVRRGLGIPDAMVRRFADVIMTTNAPSVEVHIKTDDYGDAYADNPAIDYDLRACLRNNDIGITQFDIAEVVAIWEGQNDGDDWRWIVKLAGGGYAYIRGGCDYTGWDCQSFAWMSRQDNAEACVGVDPSGDYDWQDKDPDAVIQSLTRQVRNGVDQTWRNRKDKEFGVSS